MVEKETGEHGRGLGRLVLGPLFCGMTVWLLAAVLVPNFTRCRNYGPLTCCSSNLKNIGTALEMYAADWGGHYPRNLYQLVPTYLKELPECSEVGRMTYRAEFGHEASGNSKHLEEYCLVECTGDNHANSGLLSDYPKYDTVNGLVEGRRHEPSR